MKHGSAMIDRSCEAMVVFEIPGEDGRISRMDELLDPAFLAAPRPVPPPATLPSEPARLGAGAAPDDGEAVRNLGIAEEFFDRSMAHEDVSHLLAPGAVAAQYIAATGGEFKPLRPSRRDGELRLQPYKGNAVYTNRRRFAGAGFAFEQHTVSVQRKPDDPSRRHAIEVAGAAHRRGRGHHLPGGIHGPGDTNVDVTALLAKL
jgi:hypothetical protein